MSSRLPISGLTRMLPLAALVAVGGCFATRSDVRVVQTDVASLRMEMVRSDAQLRADLTQASAMLKAVSDSVLQVSARTVNIQGDVRGETRAIQQQLLQIQQMLGTSSQALQRLRADMEARANAVPVAPPVVPPGTGTAGAAGAVPPGGGKLPADTARPMNTVGPAKLYDDGRAQLTRGSASTARMLFQQLLSDYPTSDLAPDAQYYIAASLEREKNLAGADAAYAAVVSKYPDHEKAPSALYKRGSLLLQQKNNAAAKKLFEEVVARYPQSPEAALAADRLKSIS